MKNVIVVATELEAQEVQREHGGPDLYIVNVREGSRAVEGLRIHRFGATERAMQHPNAPALIDAIRRRWMITQATRQS